MRTAIELKEIRRETRLALNQDGLDEIMVGLSLGIMAIFFLDFRLSIALVAGCAIQILVKPACRRRITYPRVGYAQLHEARGKGKARTVLLLAVALVMIGIGLFFVSQLRWLLPPYLGIILAGLAIAGVHGSTHIFDYSIAGLFLISGLLGLWLISLGSDPGVATAVQGWGLAVVLIPIGIAKLIRFLQRYPEPVEQK
ncbi:MAG: hypothetical protein JSU70_10530 [Phycisphaerales bacterium]|nr:MAG: hypothetical protein JSU70_10530 [Phycisphaerales bacterium]